MARSQHVDLNWGWPNSATCIGDAEIVKNKTREKGRDEVSFFLVLYPEVQAIPALDFSETPLYPTVNSLFALFDGTGVLVTCCLSVPMNSGKLPLGGFNDVGLISSISLRAL